MASSTIDIETKLKVLEIQAGQQASRIKQLEEFNEELKRYLVKIVANQSTLSERLSKWPWLSTPETTKRD